MDSLSCHHLSQSPDEDVSSPLGIRPQNVSMMLVSQRWLKLAFSPLSLYEIGLTQGIFQVNLVLCRIKINRKISFSGSNRIFHPVIVATKVEPVLQSSTGCVLPNVAFYSVLLLLVFIGFAGCSSCTGPSLQSSLAARRLDMHEFHSATSRNIVSFSSVFSIALMAAGLAVSSAHCGLLSAMREAICPLPTAAEPRAYFIGSQWHLFTYHQYLCRPIPSLVKKNISKFASESPQQEKSVLLPHLINYPPRREQKRQKLETTGE